MAAFTLAFRVRILAKNVIDRSYNILGTLESRRSPLVRG